MEKEFFEWHQEKERINAFTKVPFFQEREIWFSSLGANIGSEQDGKGDCFLRPIVIIRKFNDHTFWAIPLTRALKNDTCHFVFAIDQYGENAAILSQMRLIDARRLRYRIAFLSEVDFHLINEKLKALLP